MLLYDLVCGILAGSGINPFVFKVDFSTDDPSPLANPYNGEIGAVIPVQVDGTLAAAGGILTNTAQATPVEGDLGIYYAPGMQRIAGHAFLSRVNMATLNTYPIVFWGINPNVNSSNAEAALRIEGVLGVNDNNAYVGLGYSLTTGVNYEIALVLRNLGAFIFLRGGVFTDWTLVWVRTTGSTTPLYPAVGLYNGVGSFNFLRGVQCLPAPLNSDYGLADVRVADFTQSFGAELFANPNFATWGGASDPTGWTVSGESVPTREVSEVAPGNLHGGGGNGAANLFSSSGAVGVTQALATIGDIYEIGVEITAFGSGSITLYLGGSDVPVTSATAVGVYRAIGRSITGGAIWPAYMGGAGDLTVDNVTVKKLTLNTAKIASANSVHDFEFSVPVSPIAGQEIHLLYRIEAPGEELLDCWDAFIRRNSANTGWDFRLDSIVAGARTNRIAVSLASVPDAIRVIVDGNLHDCFTKNSGTWTKRGGQINNSTFATATGVNTVYSAGATPVALTSFPRNSATVTAILNQVIDNNI